MIFKKMRKKIKYFQHESNNLIVLVCVLKMRRVDKTHYKKIKNKNCLILSFRMFIELLEIKMTMDQLQTKPIAISKRKILIATCLTQQMFHNRSLLISV